MGDNYFVRNEKLIVIGLLLIFFVFGITTSFLKTETYDEPYHLTSGYSYFTGDYRMNPEHPIMLKVIAAAPLLMYDISDVSLIDGWELPINALNFSESIFYQNSFLYLFSGRFMMLLLGLLFGYFVYLLSRKFFGVKAGLLSLLFYSFSPNILGHSKLITTDLGMGGFLIIFMYFLWKYFDDNSFFNIIISGVFLGLLLLTKYSSVYFVGIFLLMFIVGICMHYLDFKTLYHYLLMCFVALVVINSFYLFDGSFNSLSDFDYLESDTMNSLSTSAFSDVPIPLPHYYVVGIDMVKAHNERGHLSYMNSEYSQFGFWYYFIELFLLKTPIAFLLLFVGLLFYRSRELLDFKHLYLIIPALLFFVLASLSNIHIGIRHIIPVYLLLFVLMGDLVNTKMCIKFDSAFVFLILLFVLTSLFSYPHYISFTNSLAIGDNSYYFADSNLDWGQDRLLVQKYLTNNPDVIWNPGCSKVEGRILVNVNHYLGIVRDPDCYSWLEGYNIIDDVGGSNLLFIVD